MPAAIGFKRTERSSGLDASPLAKLAVGVSLEREMISKKPMKKRHVKTLVFRPFHGSDRIIVGLGIDRPHDGRFLAGDPHHAAVPRGALVRVWLDHSFDVGEKIVILALQLPVVSCRASEIEDQLYRTEYGNSRPDENLRDAYKCEYVAHCGGAEKYNSQTAPSTKSLEAKPSRSVIKRIAQNVEADVVEVICHDHSFFGGRGGGETGCLGPTLVSTPLSDVRDGCLTPIPLCSELVSLVIPIVSLCRLHEGMPGVGAHSARLDTAP